MKRIDAFKICGETVQPGARKRVYLRTAKLYDHTEMRIPVEVLHGTKPGPTLFVSAAIHGDEINGVEVVRQLLLMKKVLNIRGTLLLIPIVNVFGYNSLSRYMPDRRDLNRSFPGSKKGSLTSQLAYEFMEQVVKRCDYGIDLHTGALHRTNLPQIRANLDDRKTLKLAKEFGSPVLINAKERDGSLRQAASEAGVSVLLFEGGTALRHSRHVTKGALHGVIKVMESLDMLPKRKKTKPRARKEQVFVAQTSFWVRGGMSGSLHSICHPGDAVKKGDLLGTVCDPFGQECSELRAPSEGVVIGQRILPLLNRGDAVYHIASIKDETLPDRLSYPDDREIDF